MITDTHPSRFIFSPPPQHLAVCDGCQGREKKRMARAKSKRKEMEAAAAAARDSSDTDSNGVWCTLASMMAPRMCCCKNFSRIP